jgi:hypothetical protein
MFSSWPPRRVRRFLQISACIFNWTWYSQLKKAMESPSDGERYFKIRLTLLAL